MIPYFVAVLFKFRYVNIFFHPCVDHNIESRVDRCRPRERTLHVDACVARYLRQVHGIVFGFGMVVAVIEFDCQFETVGLVRTVPPPSLSVFCAV